jgi:parallel beta-helix repeat protein
MNKNNACFLILLSLTASCLIAIQPAKASSKAIVVPDDYPTITAAIGNASYGDTIFVKKGDYLENLVVSKSLSLIGEDRSATIIDGGGTGTVVQITANSAVFSGFTVQNSGNNFTDSSIYVDCASNTSILDNLVTSNNMGIYLFESSNCILKNNTITGNQFNFGVYSSNLQGYIQNVDSSNNVDGKPIFYWVNQANKQPPTNAGYVAIINSSNIIVENSTLERNWQNVLFAYTTNSTIRNVTTTLGMDSIWLLECSDCSIYGNNVSENIWGGIALVNSSHCSIYGNNLNNNGGYGTFLSYSLDNMFHHNNFIDNPRQAWLYEFNNNTWDNGYPSGGNYWSDYNGTDARSGLHQDENGRDGIGDTAYVIDSNNEDHYPLMKPLVQTASHASQIDVVSYVIAGIGATIIAFGLIVYLMKIRKRPLDVGRQERKSTQGEMHQRFSFRQNRGL